MLGCGKGRFKATQPPPSTLHSSALGYQSRAKQQSGMCAAHTGPQLRNDNKLHRSAQNKRLFSTDYFWHGFGLVRVPERLALEGGFGARNVDVHGEF